MTDNIQGFLRSRDKNYHLFYKLVMKTQMFTKFIEECSFVSDINTSLAFFDECVERVEREEGGRLLEGEGSVSDRTVFILPPDASDLPEGAEYRGATLHKFDHSLFKEMPLLGSRRLRICRWRGAVSPRPLLFCFLWASTRPPLIRS